MIKNRKGIMTMKFECECKTDNEFRQMVEQIHGINGKDAHNWEVGATFWITTMNETLMVEYQITTAHGREDDPNEPDWFSAYRVENEEDDDADNEIATMPVGSFDSMTELKDAMVAYANSFV